MKQGNRYVGMARFWRSPPGRALAWFMRHVLKWDSSVGGEGDQ